MLNNSLQHEYSQLKRENLHYLFYNYKKGCLNLRQPSTIFQ